MSFYRSTQGAWRLTFWKNPKKSPLGSFSSAARSGIGFLSPMSKCGTSSTGSIKFQEWATPRHFKVTPSIGSFDSWQGPRQFYVV